MLLIVLGWKGLDCGKIQQQEVSIPKGGIKTQKRGAVTDSVDAYASRRECFR